MFADQISKICFNFFISQKFSIIFSFKDSTLPYVTKKFSFRENKIFLIDFINIFHFQNVRETDFQKNRSKIHNFKNLNENFFKPGSNITLRQYMFQWFLQNAYIHRILTFINIFYFIEICTPDSFFITGRQLFIICSYFNVFSFNFMYISFFVFIPSSSNLCTPHCCP